MKLPFRRTLTSALAIALFAFAPSALAAPEEPAAGAGEGEEGAEGAEGGEGAEKPKEPPPPPVDLGGWGIGGKEEEGRYQPRGKTGKLKEMEEDEGEVTEDGTPAPTVLPPPGYAYLDTALGFGDTRVVVQPSGVTDATPTASFLIGLGYRIGDTWQIGARFPISTGENNGPNDPFIPDQRDPDNYKQIAVGGVELEAKPHFILSRTLRLPVGLAIVIPTQTGDLNADPDNRGDVGVAIVNQAANESRGWEDRALFSHKRFGIVPSVGLLFDDSGFELGAMTKLEIMIRVGGNDPQPPPPGYSEVETRSASVNWVTGGKFFYGFFNGLLAPGLRLWLAVGSMNDVTATQDYGGAQFVIEPNVKSDIPFTDDEMVGMTAGVGYTLPLGGHLGGANDASTGALRIKLGMFF